MTNKKWKVIEENVNEENMNVKKVDEQSKENDCEKNDEEYIKVKAKGKKDHKS